MHMTGKKEIAKVVDAEDKSAMKNKKDSNVRGENREGKDNNQTSTSVSNEPYEPSLYYLI